MKARDPRIEAHSVHKLPSRAVAVILDYIPLLFIYGVAWDWIPDASSEYLEGLLVVIFGVLPVVYHTTFEAAFGWTPGKLMTGLRVVDKQTLRKPSLGKALTRNLLRPVDALLGYVLGFVVAVASRHRQRIGDHVAGTVVVASDFEEEVQKAEGLRRRQEAGDRAEARVSYELGKLAAFDGDYYVWNDLYEERVGNIDHLVVGPGGVTIIETKSHRGTVRVDGLGALTVDGRYLERDVLVQVHNQRRALVARMGLGDTDPDNVGGFEWLICFARGTLSPDLAPNVRRRLSTMREIRGKLRSQPRAARSREQIESMARAIAGLYGREPDHRPSGPRGARPDGRPRRAH